MKVAFYENLDDRKKLNKTITFKNEVDIIIKSDNFNLQSPMLFMSLNDIKSIGNYIYIENLNRYYFIDDIEIIKNGYYKLTLSTDYLMTFKDLILSSHGTVRKSKNINNYSSNYEVLDTIQVKKILFKKNLFSSENHLYLTGAN